MTTGNTWAFRPSVRTRSSRQGDELASKEKLVAIDEHGGRQVCFFNDRLWMCLAAAALAACQPANALEPMSPDVNSRDTATADRVALRELVDRYHAAINQRDFALLGDVFAPDAVWEALAPVNLRFEGHRSVIEGLRQSVGRQEVLVQSCSGVVITLRDARTASIHSTLTELGRERDGGAGWEAIGFYDDEARKDGDTWRFVRRTLRLRYMGKRDLPGEVR
jgi:ketosteroid isomerase-like protein